MRPLPAACPGIQPQALGSVVERARRFLERCWAFDEITIYDASYRSACKQPVDRDDPLGLCPQHRAEIGAQ